MTRALDRFSNPIERIKRPGIAMIIVIHHTVDVIEKLAEVTLGAHNSYATSCGIACFLAANVSRRD